MKTTIFCFIILVSSILARVALALDSSEVNNYARQIADPDPSVRLSGMKAITDELLKLADGAPGGAGNDVIPILSKALSDPVTLIRQGAAGGLVVIALNMNSRFRQFNPALPDLRSYPPLQAALEKAMFDPDPGVRRAATGAYALTFELNPGLQAKLIGEFNEERTSPEPGLIEILTTCGSPSPATEAFLTELLDDPMDRCPELCE